MDLKRELEDAKSLWQSIWVRIGVVLEILAFLIVGLFVADIKWRSGEAFFALALADGFDGSGIAFNAVRSTVIFFAIAGCVAVLMGCAKVVKARRLAQQPLSPP